MTYKSPSKAKQIVQFKLCTSLDKIQDESIPLLSNCDGLKGLQKTFAQIGNALSVASKTSESNVVFEEGARIGAFLSKWQRTDAEPEFQMKGLTAKPGANSLKFPNL